MVNFFRAVADFGFIFGERLPLESAMVLYDQIDVILEQFVIGWYGLQAVEFMAKGRPVVVFIRREDLAQVPNLSEQELPFIIVDHPHDLSEKMRQICEMSREQLYKIGMECRKYVLEHHDVEKIARDLEREYGQL